MSLQIIISPLSTDASPIASCEKYFHSAVHHPSTPENPYDIYVLKTALGTEVESTLQSRSLHLDVGTSALNDTSLRDALFEVARWGPCAVWSDDAEAAAVADPELIKTARSILGSNVEFVESIGSGADLFHLLFGYEAPRAASPDLAPGLVALEFLIDERNHHRATRTLPSGVVLQLDPDEHLGWHETEGVSVGLASRRFADVMSGWTSDLSGSLAELDPRKARQDSDGFILWSGHLPFGQFPATVETLLLGTYENAMPLCDLVEHLTNTPNSKALAKKIFGGVLTPFVMPTEGLWVFLFLMAEAGCDREAIYDSYTRLKADGATFHTKGSLCLDAVDAYLELYESRLDDGR